MNKHKNAIETIVRGVWLHEGKVLFCQSVEHGYLYLPGGHIEPGETAAGALAREMREELGVTLGVGRFIGASEACFKQRSWKTGKRERHQEINLLFELLAPVHGGVKPGKIASQEKHIRFVWLSPADLAADGCGKVLPASVVPTITFHVEHGCEGRGPVWATDWE
jgi:8-oxo-dGTP diphosphatase